jgi:hypothetical protein
VLLESSSVLEQGATPPDPLGTEVAQESLRACKEIMLL